MTPAPQQEVQGQQQVQGYPRSLVFNYLLFASLGVACSLLWHSYYGVGPGDIHEQLLILSTHTHVYSLEEVRAVLQGTNCEDVKQEAKIPDELMYVMGTKLRYQFDPVVEDAEFVEHCHAIKVLKATPIFSLRKGDVITEFPVGEGGRDPRLLWHPI